jgi:hypothetical protein
MSGSANVIKGNGTKGSGTLVGTNTDPLVEILTDNNQSTRHLRISLPTWQTKWNETECSAKDKWNAKSGECVAKK